MKMMPGRPKLCSHHRLAGPSLALAGEDRTNGRGLWGLLTRRHGTIYAYALALKCTSLHAHLHTDAHVHVNIHMYICTYVCTYMYKYICTYIYIYVCI